MNTVKILFLAAFLNAVTWMITIPIWQYPDEQAHFAQVQDIAELGKTPSIGPDTSYEISVSEKILGTERDDFGNNKFTYHPEYQLTYAVGLFGPKEREITNLSKSARTTLAKNEATHNPPLYYFLGSLFYKIFYNGNLFTRVYAVRMMSAFLYLATVFVGYQIGLTIFTKNKILPIVLAALVAFMPMYVFSSTGVLPDPLTNLLFTVIIFFCLKTLSGVKIPYLIGLTLAIILGVLTRQQFLIALSFVLIAILFNLNTNFIKTRKISLVIIFLIMMATLFLLRSFLYRFLVVSPFRIPESSSLVLNKLFDYQFIFFMKDFAMKMIAQTLPWYWGVYKWLSLTIPHINYQIINRIIIFALIGILIKFSICIKDKKIDGLSKIVLFLMTISFIYFIIFAIWDYFFFISHGFHFGYQGRYFFPLIVPHMAILLIGLNQLFELFFRRNSRYLLILIAFLMIILNDISLSYVMSSYYDISNLTAFINQISQYKPQVFKGYVFLIIIVACLITQVLFLMALFKKIVRVKI